MPNLAYRAGKAIVKLIAGEHKTLSDTIDLASALAHQAHHSAPAAKKLLDAAIELRNAIQADQFKDAKPAPETNTPEKPAAA